MPGGFSHEVYERGRHQVNSRGQGAVQHRGPTLGRRRRGPGNGHRFPPADAADSAGPVLAPPVAPGEVDLLRADHVASVRRDSHNHIVPGRRRITEGYEGPAPVAVDTVAWVHLENGRILCARPRGKDIFYIPGGKREGAETDLQVLLREITEELTVALRPETVRHVGTYQATQPVGRENVRWYG